MNGPKGPQLYPPLKEGGWFVSFEGEPVNDDLSAKTVAKLKAICKENDLSTGGKKAQLIERIETH